MLPAADDTSENTVLGVPLAPPKACLATPVKELEMNVQLFENKEYSATEERLIEGALGAWESRGNAAISARAIAQSVGQPVSSIYYHFADLERLLLASQSRALALTKVWCEGQLSALPAEIRPLGTAFAPLMAGLIEAWSTEHRRLAFVWHECRLLAWRNRAYLPAVRAWDELWRWFWGEVCARAGIGEFASLTTCMFDGESMLHLIRWRPIIDTACLYETCQGWGAWLEGRPALEGPWRRYARLEAISALAPPEPLSPMAEKVASAAADLVMREGPAALTHRAVATEAGLTLGAVSYHYRTSTELFQIAFETLYRRAMGEFLDPNHFHSMQDYAEYRSRIMAEKELHEKALSRPILIELFIAAARDTTLIGSVAHLRYLRGRTSRNLITALLGDDEFVSPLEAALISNLIFGLSRRRIGLELAESFALADCELRQIEVLLLASRGRTA